MDKKPTPESSSATPKLRVWHIPQIPGKPFHVEVQTVDEAKKILRVLADYDVFQFSENIKPDFSNASGLESFEAIDDGDPDWFEWYDEDGYDVWGDL